MDRAQKSAVIDEVTAQIQESDAVFAVDYRGISVPQAAALRTRLRETDATFRVTKNTLTERAADNADAPALKDYLQGPTAMTFVRGDAAAAAKALADFSRSSGLLTFKGGWMNGAPLTAEQIVAISRLPSREVLYGRLVGMVASPLTGLAAGMSNLISGLGRQLAQIAEQGLVGGSAPAEPVEAQAPADGVAAEEATDEVVEAEDEITAATEAPADDAAAE
ncbi:MAG: large subunit ribosomal protein [Solirubrobacteraceae bacterium]|nr:large subunit ribosomal protein [Solirubrobacteraceae bacterium]